MERGVGGSAASPARATGGGVCDRFLTFLANNLSMNRPKNVTDGPRSSGAGGYHQLEEQDAFAIRIERAEFELSDHGDAEGHGPVATVLEGTGTASATAASDEQKQHKRAAAADAAADHPPVAAAAAAVGETKLRKTVTIKEDGPDDAAGNKGAPPALERKKSLFKKRQASTSGGGAGEDQQGGGRAPRRSGLRPRMPAVLRVPSNINEKSSTFIEARRKSFGTGKTAAPADK